MSFHCIITSKSMKIYQYVGSSNIMTQFVDNCRYEQINLAQLSTKISQYEGNCVEIRFIDGDLYEQFNSLVFANKNIIDISLGYTSHVQGFHYMEENIQYVPELITFDGINGYEETTIFNVCYIINVKFPIIQLNHIKSLKFDYINPDQVSFLNFPNLEILHIRNELTSKQCEVLFEQITSIKRLELLINTNASKCDFSKMFAFQLTYLSLTFTGHKKSMPKLFHEGLKNIKTLQTLIYKSKSSTCDVDSFGDMIAESNITDLYYNPRDFPHIDSIHYQRFFTNLLKSKLKKLTFYTRYVPEYNLLADYIKRCQLRYLYIIWRIDHEFYKTCIPHNLTLEEIPYKNYPDINFYLVRNESYRVLSEFSTVILGWNIEIHLYVLLWIIDWTVPGADKHHQRNITMLERLRDVIKKINTSRNTNIKKIS